MISKIKLKMKLLQDLPSVALEKILTKLDYVGKMNLLLASDNNQKLNLEIMKLCYINRPNFCPFCMLCIGTDYEQEEFHDHVGDLHNQLLNRMTGDGNWIWNIIDKKCRVEVAHESEKLESAISCHLGDGKQKCHSILTTLKCKTYSKRTVVLNHIKFLYNILSHEKIQFATRKELYEHILSHHSEFLDFDSEKKDPASLQKYFEKYMYETEPSFNLPSMYDPFYRTKINRKILLHISCTYLVFVQTLETIMMMPIDRDNRQVYFNTHLKVLFTICCYTIQSMTFVTAKGFNARTLLHIQRMLKLFEVLNAIFECLV